MTQPALSKTLARLREHFDDQLSVRVAFEMKPTSKTLCLAPQIQNILREVSLLESEQLPFMPVTSKRDFKFAGPDAAVVLILSPLISYLQPHVPVVHRKRVEKGMRVT